MPSEEQKPTVDVPTKSSMEILSELFNSFDAEPPLIIKKEKTESSKKSKKSKKKHKHHKEKKHKKKDKKRKRDSSSSSDRSEIDLAEILIKQEKESTEKKIKIEGTDLTVSIDESVVKKDPDEKPEKSDSKKIEIKLKTSSFESVKSNIEEGELSNSADSSDDRKHRKRKHKSDHDKAKKKKRRSRSPEKADTKVRGDDLRNKIKGRHRSKERRSRSRDRRSRSKDRRSRSKERRSRSKERHTKDDHFHKGREKDREKEDDVHKGKDRDKHRSKDKDKYKEYDYKSKRNGRDSSLYKDDDFYKSKDHDGDKETKWGRDRHRLHHERDRDRRHRDRSGSRESSSYIDKKKLLEIARKNAIQMMKSGSLPGALTLGPQAQEKVIAAIKAGGKTIEELTDFCKTLSKKEEMGDLSSATEDNGSDSDTDKPFHHPFQIKDRPTSITMNIKNSVPLPLKSTQERSSELRMQFPVSSGQLHRKTESEWVPVSPKKPDPQPQPSKAAVPATPLPIEAAPPPPPPPPPPAVPQEAAAPVVAPGPQVFPQAAPNSAMDIGSIVSQRLSAMRKLQENPNDVQALNEMYKSNKEMQSWAQSKQQPGQFTGTTGAQILSQAELSSGYQAWAKKDQLQSATPVSGGMGMHLLQKMGWKPGEGLGKEKTGALEPLLLEVKLDKKGLVANEEQKRKKKQAQGQWNAKALQNKHPVSLLGEYASKKKLGAPQYTLCFECGPDHKKNFLFKVVLNGVEYKPNIASPNKKEAKAAAATVCLQQLGLLPPPPPLPQ